ncbi:MAG: two-component system response regulator CreB [Desulfobacteraceae bacterium]|jgi:two-component system catabolic regulation response regulator CreB|nr:two-component system response regulator CreB [Desulfobacteraceae bacterium]
MRPLILVVEDEPAIADTIQYALETEGFQARCLSSGGGVLQQLAEEAVDLVVLDIGLPDVNGMELCKEIRKENDVPVIFLTARSDEIDRVVGLEIGADDYMVKPFSPRELTARIRAVLRRAGGRGTGAENTGFSVDESRRRITYCGSPLDLSRTEYRLLQTLVGRPGHVFTRERLMELAWDEPDASMDRTVDAHIKTIRAKLRAVRPEVDPIVTHRGVGYALSEET